MSYRILTDSCCDFPAGMAQELGVSVTALSLVFRGEVFTDFTDDSLKTMYAGLRAGESATTSAINPQQWAAAMEPYLRQGEDLLVMAFSSGLSATCQSAKIAAQELQEQYPQRQIRVVDTLCASLGQGLLVWHACRKKQEGLSLQELADWCEENKLKLCHWFTVDDLMYLKRGGRVSAATALLGTMLSIKPVLHVDDEGHLINVSKVRGRKASLNALVEKFRQTGLPGQNETVFISHGDCIEDARYVEKKLREECGVQNVVIGYVGAVIGSHSGPGTVALFFLGEKR